ncbi:unnamed protein product [Umbelopsis sp. WA50703]
MFKTFQLYLKEIAMSRSSISGRSHTTNSTTSEDDRRPSGAESIEAPVSSRFHPKHGQIALGIVKPHATIAGWLGNHIPASFGFSKQWKQRYFVLVDSMLFIFKTDDPTMTWRNFMELNKDTIVFVTNAFSNKLYCLEIRKPGQERSWYIQTDGAEELKRWLGELKDTIKWIRTGKKQVHNEDNDTISTLSDSMSGLDMMLSSQSSLPSPTFQPPPPDYTTHPPPPVPSDHLPPKRPIARQMSQPRYKGIPPPLPPPTTTLPPTPDFRTSQSAPVSRAGSMRLVPPPTPPPCTSLPAIPGTNPYVKSPTKASRS